MSKQSEQVANNFKYHKPFGTQPARYEAVRSKAFEYANWLLENTPPSREQSVALTKLEEVVFWANASIARNEVETTEVTESKAA